MAAQPGTTFHRLGLIGTGSFGRVHAAVNMTTFHLAAVKEIRYRKESTEDYVYSRDMARNEVDILRRLHHPHIIEYFGCQEKFHKMSIAMEYVNSDLSKHLRERPKGLSHGDTQFIIRQILEAVSHMHSIDVWHLDLKPSNVLLGPHLNVKVTDFGLGRCVSGLPHVKLAHPVVTAQYRAPEVFQLLPYTSAVDLWSIGIIFHELLTGKRLFPETKSRKVRDSLFRKFGKPFFDFWPADDVLKVHESIPPYQGLTFDEIMKDLMTCPMAVNFAQVFLYVDPGQRWTAMAALAHPYLHTEAIVTSKERLEQCRMHHIDMGHTDGCDLTSPSSPPCKRRQIETVQ